MGIMTCCWEDEEELRAKLAYIQYGAEDLDVGSPIEHEDADESDVQEENPPTSSKKKLLRSYVKKPILHVMKKEPGLEEDEPGLLGMTLLNLL